MYKHHSNNNNNDFNFTNLVFKVEKGQHIFLANARNPNAAPCIDRVVEVCSCSVAPTPYRTPIPPSYTNELLISPPNRGNVLRITSIVLVSRQQSPLALFLMKLSLSKPLSRHDSLVFGLDFVSVARELIALFRLRPEVIH